MKWLLQQWPACNLIEREVEEEFELLRAKGGGETTLTDTMLQGEMVLEVLPEQGLEYGFIYFRPERKVIAIVKTEDEKK
jgi:hypothetical protein